MAALEFEGEVLAEFEEFIAEGYVSEVLHVIKTGKEASAYLCRAGREVDAPYCVAKLYHELDRRNFARAGAYTDGRVVLDSRVLRAVAGKTAIGRDFAAGMWVDHEYETLDALYSAGADVPEPYGCTARAVLMAYQGDGEGEPAPQLQHVAPSPAEAAALRDRLLANVALWLRCNVVHADLSAYNVLYTGPGQVAVIDFPQAVDPRFAPAARSLLERDLRNLAHYFARHGAPFDPDHHARRLWDRFRRGQF